MKLGVFELTDCGGCALNLLFLYDKLLDLLEFYEIAEFHMATSKKSREKIDVALVTGTVSTQRDLEVLRDARNRSEYLIALGTCATHGSVQGVIENSKEAYRRVYGNGKPPVKLLNPKPVTDYVPVDFAIPGCPYDKEEVFQVLIDIAKGIEPVAKDYPVCLECKLNEYECVLLKKRIPCLGPVTAGGCNAKCPSYGLGCIGCRGPSLDNNVPGMFEVLKEILPDEEIARKLRTFARW
ncbi:hydrogenase [Pyrococcus furiosus DSM 3638]|uniref:Sulfhydrogenase 2 subunit delta n=3 Tax=Pyrococcus furiosus TaxID=2261 RepID=HYD2D_PYRFU|nr:MULTISPECIES: NAD(P)-dependent hydrogenase/sulfhydrogenase 2 subunit delta [Pyrococcus]E7FHF8.1 RecName: Full=Sulfhydrogenase 2 subunit delta; AltName: Full=Hydrogen dehydrogenase (NAD(P)(+)); AltName: Full=Hydrogenase-II subunit delta; Short=H-II delta; AltName: Full=NADP-reducing hydrogenase subunit ShyD; AltName: Full=Sulfhydrogenase II subunit delta [Pyrococcus furiosus DSM 3638]AAF61853.1 sulfhydrogenase II subunit d [Pyrococcus furiosus DSM 3638]AAL81455.1 H-II delta (hydrogenase subuni